jgi:hypothetical protein
MWGGALARSPTDTKQNESKYIDILRNIYKKTLIIS